MDAFSRTIDDVLVIGTAAFVPMSVAAVMAGVGIYLLIKDREKRGVGGASKQKLELSNAIRGQVLEFYVPDNFRANRQCGARLRSHLSASQQERRG
jgi:hypothetical protein